MPATLATPEAKLARKGRNGVCRWLDRDAAGLLVHDLRAPFLIRKHGEQPGFYWVGCKFKGGRVVRVTLLKELPNGEAGPEYWVTLGGKPACTCKAGEHGKVCKHVQSLKAALDRIGLL